MKNLSRGSVGVYAYHNASERIKTPAPPLETTHMWRVLHKCLPRHPTGGNCPKHRATLFYLLRDVKPLNKSVLNRCRIILFPGIILEGPRIDKELGLVKC